MQGTTFSANHITSRRSLGFRASEYSRFKYGSKDCARRMGRELANKFVTEKASEILRVSDERTIVVYPSPFNFIPTATFALKDYFVPMLNKFLAANGRPPVQEGKVYRSHSYNDDYSSMSAEERQNAIGSESFQMDVEFARGKFLIFMDDIRVTGGHENRMREMVTRLRLAEHSEGTEWMFMYYAELVNREEDPNIESYLNMQAIDGLLSINSIIRDEEFIFNTRNVKYMLKRSPEEFGTFIQYQSRSFVETLHSYAIGNSYHLAEEYSENFYQLQKLIQWSHWT